MNRTRKKYAFLIFLLVTLTAWVAWRATEPNPYWHDPDVPQVHIYPWQYPALMFVFGLVVIGLLSFRKPLWSFVGATLAFGTAAGLLVVLALTFMHSLPVHGTLFFVALFCSVGLLFVSGYTCAIWRSGASSNKGAA